MIRIAAEHAKPGMTLGRDVFDKYGRGLLAAGQTLTEDDVATLIKEGGGEVLVKDPRMSDVFVAQVISGELEARCIHGLYKLLTSPGAAQELDQTYISNILSAATRAVQQLFPVMLGAPNLTGWSSQDGYDYNHPVQTAGLAIVMGRSAGLDKQGLIDLMMAAILMNVGYLKLEDAGLFKSGPLTAEQRRELEGHPQASADLVRPLGLGDDVISAILQHHERWDGKGYPDGLRGGAISPYAQMIAIADTYYSLLSPRPQQKAYRPHEAAEFVIANSGEIFDPELVQFFARNIPHYVPGHLVRLNTGEIAGVIDSNMGHVGRPIVRIFTEGRSKVTPYVLDLSEGRYMNKLIAEILV